MAKEKKSGFRPGVYGIVAGVIVAVLLVVMTIFAFTTRYTAFSPDKVALNYVDSVVQTGDGYNSQKVTLIAKNQKHGNFIINAYMLPFVNDGDDVKKADFVGKGTEEEQKAIDAVYTKMYEEYVSLIKTYGYDNYDAIYSNYFEKLAQTRKAVYGDEYMDTEYMFGAFESNVQTYAESLTGSDTKFAADNKTVISEAKDGLYDSLYGKDYKLTCKIAEETKILSDDEAKAYVAEYKERIAPVAESGEAKANAYNLSDEAKENMVKAYNNLDCSDSINGVALCSVEVVNQNDESIASLQLYIVKIGNSWYVDNTNCDTSVLYFV